MTKKNLSIFTVALGILSLLSLSILPVLAADNTGEATPNVTVPSEVTALTELNPESEGSTHDLDSVTKLDVLQKKGQIQIKNRITALNKFVARVNASKLSETQKTQLQTDVTANLTGLTDLGSKIAAGTDVTTVRALDKSIYTDFRIYAVVIPRDTGEMQAWLGLNNLTQVLTSLANVQPKIEALKAKGVDVRQAESLVTQINTILADTKTKFETSAATLSAIKPADYPTSGTTFRQVRQIFRDAKKEVHHARQSISRLNGIMRTLTNSQRRKELREARGKAKPSAATSTNDNQQ